MEQEHRPYIQYTWRDLTLLVHGFGHISGLQTILAELKYRKTKKAKQVYEAVVEKITELQTAEEMPFRWPSTAVVADSRQALSGNFFDYEDGLLKFMGYAVGQSGCHRRGRQEILDYVFHGTLPRVQSADYMQQWGANGSIVRLQKLANCIATFARNAKRRRNASMELAIAEWEEDLAYLKDKYYRPADGYGWPDTFLD